MAAARPGSYNRSGSYRRPGRRKRKPVWPYIALAAAAVAIIVLVIVLIARGGSDDNIAPAPTPAPTAEPTHTPEPVATTEPTPEPTAEPAKAGAAMPGPTAAGYIPVVSNAVTDRKMIAITVDDCNQISNTRQIIDCILENGGNFTLFPIGTNVLRESFREVLIYAYENGVQIENHTYEHLGHYGLDDEALARQYYMQKAAVDYVLNVDYQQHFVRPMGGNGRDDQRLHMYCDLMGVKAIAHWNVSGGLGLKDLALSLAPGNIYLFHTTDKDLEKLLKFVPYIVEQGYELVTLNEMFSLPDNEVKPLDMPVRDREIPLLGEYTLIPRDFESGDFAWGAYLIQQKLIKLGFLEGEPDGIFGDGTKLAVATYQEEKGLEPTGKADIATQRMLFEDEPEIRRLLLGE